ncbi:MAG: sulfatase-like hydrolase/transferase [Phycisphaerales bacterium JB038]
MQRVTSVVPVFCLAAAAAIGRGEDPPNILLILADDLGVPNVGAYTRGPNGVPGNPPPTPNLDALAANGVLFRTAWATPICSPSRATLMTGRHGFRTGLRCNVMFNNGLPLEERTLPELLGAIGYGSALIGKWHLGCTGQFGGLDAPRTAGWDHHAGTLGAAPWCYYVWTKVTDGALSTCHTYITTENINDTLAWAQDQTGPWCCLLALNAPHSPFHEPPEDLHSFDLSSPSDLLCYKAMIEAMDTEIGRLLDGLGAELDDTLVIVTSDNGTPNSVLEPPYTTGKGTVYEGGVLVPLIVSGPMVADPGREHLEPVVLADVFATVIEAAGVDPQALAGVSIDGVSLLPMLTDASAPAPRACGYTELVTSSSARGHFAVRSPQYKLVQRSSSEEFFDLQADPLETNDLLHSGLPLSLEQSQACNGLRDEFKALRLDLCAADLDADGIVGPIDLGLVLRHYEQGANPAAGDIDGDGDVDQHDLGLLLAEYGFECW